MRIVHLDSGLELRGGQRQALLLYEGLARQGVDQTILCRGELLRRTGGSELTAMAVWRAARRADILHAHDARAHTLAASFAQGAPIVVSRRVAFPVKDGPLSRWKYRRPTLYLAVSEFVRQRLVEAGVDPARVTVVPDGVAPREAEFRPVSDKPLVVIPASDDPLKGVALAREACRLAGLELLRSKNLDVDLPRADLFLYLTENEGLGSAILLAGMFAKPIVASRTGGVPEAVLDGETGLLTDNDPAAVAAALNRLRHDPALARRLAEAARARALAEFTSDKMIARTLEAYRRVLSANPSP
ncbi:MAG: glycosyltransferase family 4 protein [Bryobacterales bacterium]